MLSSSLGIHKCLNKSFLVGCPSTTFSALELRARATSTAPTCEERHSHFLWHIFRAWSEPQGAQCKFHLVVCQASCHLAIWWKRKHNGLGVRDLESAAAASPSGCTILDKPSVLSRPHSSKALPASGQSLASVFQPWLCRCLLLWVWVHRKHLAHFPWTWVCWSWPWRHSPCCSHKTVREHLKVSFLPRTTGSCLPKAELLIRQEWPM